MTTPATIDAAAAWLSRLVRIPSVNPAHAGPRAVAAGPLGEAALATELADVFGHLGASHVELAEVPGADGRPNVYGEFAGDSDRWLCLDVHLDTVGVEHMTRDPFDGAIEDGRVWGRGSVDTKAMMAVTLAALEAMHRDGRRPAHNVLLVGTVAEEAGGFAGAAAFNDRVKEDGRTFDELWIAEPTECTPVYGHLGGLGIEFTVHGVAAHSSRPDLGRNAIHAAAELILAFESKHREIVARGPSPVGLGSLSTTTVAGGIVRNAIPDSCTLYVGLRLVPGEDPAVVRDEVIAFAQAHCPLPVTADGQPGVRAVYGSADSSLCHRVAGWSGRVPTTTTLGTNAFKYDLNSIAGDFMVFGPGSIEQAHAAQEWCDLDSLATALDAMTRWLSGA